MTLFVLLNAANSPLMKTWIVEADLDGTLSYAVCGKMAVLITLSTSLRF